jgi:DNA-binding transcriptional MerR regulator
MSSYSIKDLEKLSGIKAHTIRIWEVRYSLLKPQRTATNRRYYSDDDLRRIINIGVLNRSGVKVSKIARLTDRQLEERVARLKLESEITETAIESMLVGMLDLDEDEFRSIINRTVLSIGFNNTFNRIVSPFLMRLGVLWQTGSISPAQEHFVSSIIRNWIISATEALPEMVCDNRKRVLLFLPESELHDIGLLYSKYYIKSLGHKILYLGQMTPLNTLVEISEKWNPDIIITGTKSELTEYSISQYLEILEKMFKNKVILVSGLLGEATDSLKFKGVIPFKTMEEVLIYL